MVIYPTGVKVHENFGDFRSSRSPDIRLPHFVTNDDHGGIRWSSHKGDEAGSEISNHDGPKSEVRISWLSIHGGCKG